MNNNQLKIIKDLINLFYEFTGVNKETDEFYLTEDGFHHHLVELLEPNSENMTNQEYAEILDAIQSEFCPSVEELRN